MHVHPPLQAPQLKPTVVPRSYMRAMLLENILESFGLPRNFTQNARDGLLSGSFYAMTIHGIDHNGESAEQVYIAFADLVTDDEVSLALDGKRSIIELVSRKLAHAVAFSIGRIQRRNLRLWVTWHFTEKANQNYDATMRRFNLSHGGPRTAGGVAPVEIFKVSPQFDRGITYTHSTTSPMS